MYARHALVAAVTLSLLSTLAALAEPGVRDWPQYRGPNRDGISAEEGLLDAWPDGGPAILWRVPIGEGFSAVSVVGGRLFAMFADGGKEYAAALDAESGQELWRVELGRSFVGQFGNGPRSTPTVAGDLVYALGSSGRLVALRPDDGKVAWEIQLTSDLGGFMPQWGFTSSPLVEGDLLVIEAGGGEGKLIAALDRHTGKTRWSALDGRAGYSSPVPATIRGVRQLVFVTDHAVVGLAAADGRTLWSHPWEGGIPMPVFVAPDKVFVSRHDSSAMLQIGADGAREMWTSEAMRNHVNTSVAYGGHLYGFDVGTLKCLDAATGEQKWAKRGLGKGSLVVADGHLIVLSERGKVLLAEANPERWVEKGSFQALQGTTWTTPVVAGGRLYLRGMSELLSADVSLRVTPSEAPKG